MGYDGIGLLALIVDGIRYSIGSVKERRERKEFKEKTYNPKTGTYLDNRCVERKYSDDSFLWTTRNYNGDLVQYNKDHVIVRNFSQEERESKPGTVTEVGGSHSDNSDMFKRAAGKRYIDRKNGKEYVIRTFIYDGSLFGFYVDVVDGCLIRPTDSTLKLEEMAKSQGKKYYDLDFLNKIIIEENSKERDEDDPYNYFRNKHAASGAEFSDETIKFILKRRQYE